MGIKRFARQCGKTNWGFSEREEKERYETPPWNNRILKSFGILSWQKFMNRAEDDDKENS